MGLLLVDVMEEIIRTHDVHLYCRINLIAGYVSKVHAMTRDKKLSLDDEETIQDCLDDIEDLRESYHPMMDNDPEAPQQMRSDFDQRLDEIVLDIDEIVYRHDLLTLSAMRSRKAAKFGSEEAFLEENEDNQE